MRDGCEIEETAWRVNRCSWAEASRLASTLNIPMVVAMVMAGRGLSDPDTAREFVECSFSLPDPFLFEDMVGAVEVVSAAVAQGRKIIVHGDYDADGITATALLVSGLAELGAHVDWYLPSRFEEGYGLSRQAVETIVAGGAGLLITVDCGVNYPDEVAFAKDLGLEVVVVDHHRPGPRLPDCHLVHHVKGRYPHADLCGVGLALKLIHALHATRFGVSRQSLPESLNGALDLVAVGTIADLADLKGENRYYVKEGLKLINLGRRVGLRALAEVCGCSGVVDSGTVAFRLAPRLNAPGRLADASRSLRLLLTRDETEARSLADALHGLNSERQELERKIFEEAVKQLSKLAILPPAVVLAGEGWHEGVVGIVASRLVERYQRPTVLLGVRDGVAKGSGRSIPAYDLFAGLTACGQLLAAYGGHAQAAGLTLEAQSVDHLRRALEDHAGTVLRAEDLTPSFRADAVICSDELNADTARALASLEPHGNGNARPRLLLVDSVLRDCRTTRNGLHLQCGVEVGGVKLPAIGFGMGEKSALFESDSQIRSIGAQLRLDEWHGHLRPQLVLERIGAGTGAAADSVGGCLHCARCSDESVAGPEAPTSGQESVNEGQGWGDWPEGARDLRDRPGRLTVLAQVLATRERAVLLTCSPAHSLTELRNRLPLELLGGGNVVCVNRSCANTAAARVTSAMLSIVEWEVSGLIADAIAGCTHVIALDPPFREAHQLLLSLAGGRGATIHLLYGAAERAASIRLLGYLLHPRFAMVCLYKAMAETDGAACEAFSKAREIAWDEARVVLTTSDLGRAQNILLELGLERVAPGKAKLDARNIAAYRQAEADYEECVKLCQTP